MDTTVERDSRAQAVQDAPRWIRPADFARQTGVPVRTVYELIYTGRLKATQIGGRRSLWMVEREELTALFERGRRIAAA